MDDQLICTAGFEANASDYFPKSAIEHAADKRLTGREKRLELQLDEARAERGGNRFIEAGEAQYLEIPGLMKANKDAFAYVEQHPAVKAIEVEPVIEAVVAPVDVWKVPPTPELRYPEFLRLTDLYNIGEMLTQHQQTWITKYPQAAEYRVMAAQYKKVG